MISLKNVDYLLKILFNQRDLLEEDMFAFMEKNIRNNRDKIKERGKNEKSYKINCCVMRIYDI